MCGIGFILNSNQETDEGILCNDLLSRRGPDANNVLKINHGDHRLTFSGSVLWLQGEITSQPILSLNGDILVWNGDIYNLADLEEKAAANDGQYLIDNLTKCIGTPDILKNLLRIRGPWSFVFYKKQTGKIYFGRDCFGRHSLLWSYDDRAICENLVICSSGSQAFLSEVPASGVFELDLSDCLLTLHRWDMVETLDHFQIGETLKYPVSALNCTLPSDQLGLTSLEKFLSDNIQLVQNFEKVLLESVLLRVTLLPQYCRVCTLDRLKKQDAGCCHAKVAILFSGGLDSTVLTVLAHQCLPEGEPVDLLNVAFEQEGKNFENGKKYEVPDRISGREAFEEISRICNRNWNLIEIDVSRDELSKWRNSHVVSLVHPLASVLDESIGCALWFATRGAGKLVSGSTERILYTSEARVVLVGSGADEQLGGYSRHANKFRTESWPGLIDEIKMDISRISSRNLGRDDRVISDHGRSGRTPFLDEHVVDFLNLLPIEKKMDLRLPRGVGDKIILRALASKLGLIGTAVRPKRAMQFGTRIANSREKGSDVSRRMLGSD